MYFDLKKLSHLISACIGCALFFLSTSAYADRIIKFYGSGDNAALYGLYKAAPTASSCKITINNQSGQSQDYKLDPSNIAATGLSAGSYTLTTTPGSLATGAFQTIANDISHNYVFRFNALPTLTTGTQHVECNGTITMRDTASGSPGSLGFSGIINTYTEEQTSSGNSTGSAVITGSSPMPGFVPLSTGQN